MIIMAKKKINILITGCGAPGIPGTVFSIKQFSDQYDIFILGTDTNSLAVGKHFCDKFAVIPSFNDTKNYLKSLIDLCEKNNIDVIIPQNTLELEILSKNKISFEQVNTKILISDNIAIKKSNNKFELMKVAEKIGIPYPSYTQVGNIHELKEALISFGWPKKKVVVKPPLSNGSRGVRIIDESIDLKEKFFNEKPGILSTNFEIISLMLGDEFNTLLVMEYLDGPEYSVDIFRHQSVEIVVPRSRGSIKSGITFFGTIEDNDLIKEYSLKLSRALNLNFCFGFQFKMKNNIPHIIECNPRVQGSMVISTLGGANIIFNSVLALLKFDLIKMEVIQNTTFTRYWGGISENSKNKIII